jgi:hypothetical protein
MGMKKIIVTGIVLSLAACFTSCKKDYTCHCEKTSNGGDEHFTVTAKKKDAKAACEAIKTSNPSVYSSCSL